MMTEKPFPCLVFDLDWKHHADGLWAKSQVWDDRYWLTHDESGWSARFKGELLQTSATLEECMLCCLVQDQVPEVKP